MKKIGIFLLSIMVCGLIVSGCIQKKVEEGEVKVYSFYGENEEFAISNGVIVLTPTEEILDGGILKLKGEGEMSISNFSLKICTLSDNFEEVLLYNETHDMTGKSINVEGEIGQVSGEGYVTRMKEKKEIDNLYCEIKITNLEGEQQEYQIPLTLKEIKEND